MRDLAARPVLRLCVLGLASGLWVFALGATDALASLDSLGTALDSSFTFREVCLPPGVPSVALRSDETAVLWNPAGLAMSKTYYVGYAWKGTYLEDARQVAVHFLMIKSRGFGLAFSRDDVSDGVKNTVYVALARSFPGRIATGVTAKWKGAFNYDCGAVARLGKRMSVGLVGRNLRNRSKSRRYWEGGVGIYAVRKRLLVFSDVVAEDSPWRKATADGGGLVLHLADWATVTTAYFTDGEDNNTFRTTLQIGLPRRVIEGEYSKASDDWQTLSARLSVPSH